MVDLGRGVLDLVVARESGKLMYYNREDLSSVSFPKNQTVLV
jgi:hypothetical protein